MIKYATFLFAIMLLACSPKTIPNKDSSTSTSVQTVTPESYQVYLDGKFKEVFLDKEPKPRQGESQYFRDLYLEMRYPAAARENNVQGEVLFEILIDKAGIVQDIKMIQGLSVECDAEALKAITRGCSAGFSPAVYKSTPVQVKHLLPVRFKLQ